MQRILQRCPYMFGEGLTGVKVFANPLTLIAGIWHIHRAVRIRANVIFIGAPSNRKFEVRAAKAWDNSCPHEASQRAIRPIIASLAPGGQRVAFSRSDRGAFVSGRRRDRENRGQIPRAEI